MSIYDELRQDHRRVKDSLSKLSAMSPRAAKSRERAFEELKALVTAHSRAEEKVFYETLKGEKTTKDLALEGREEHHVVDVIMREMSRLSPRDDQWTAKLSVLKENLEHHIDEEEKEIFAKARSVLDGQAAERLGEQFTREKSRRLTVLEKAA